MEAVLKILNADTNEAQYYAITGESLGMRIARTANNSVHGTCNFDKFVDAILKEITSTEYQISKCSKLDCISGMYARIDESVYRTAAKTFSVKYSSLNGCGEMITLLRCKDGLNCITGHVGFRKDALWIPMCDYSKMN